MRFEDFFVGVVVSVVAVCLFIYKKKVPEYIFKPVQPSQYDYNPSQFQYFKVVFTRPNDETANLPDGWRMDSVWAGHEVILRDMAQRRADCAAMAKEYGIESIDSLPTIDKPALVAFAFLMVWAFSTIMPSFFFGFLDMFRQMGSIALPPIGRFIADLVGWGPDDWLMFRVFYEYYLIHDWDKRTFKYLIRVPESFWGRVFSGTLNFLVYIVPAIIVGAICALPSLDREMIKSFFRKYFSTGALWAASIAVLHKVYPYFVWWPRPILFIDYFFLLIGSLLTTTAVDKIKVFIWGNPPRQPDKAKVKE